MAATMLTGEQSADLAAWRTLALRRMPYLASVLFALRPVACDELPTIAVDAQWRLYVNFGWAAGCTPDFMGQALCHEAGHLLADHARFATPAGVTPAQAVQWNIAADCAWNDDLRDAGCTELTDAGFLPGDIGAADHLTPQAYFRHLQANPPTATGDRSGTLPDPGCGSGSGGTPIPGELGGAGRLTGTAKV